MPANKKILWILIVLLSCKTKENVPGTNDLVFTEDIFHDQLSDYNFFSDLAAMTAHEEVIPYHVISPLFSDYAQKVRYVYIPKDGKVQYVDNNQFIFPEGSVLIKHFYYDEFQIEEGRKLETRLLILKNGEWHAVSYIWNEEETDAKRSAVGDIFPIKMVHSDQIHDFEYVVPNKNQCKSCHNRDEKIEPLGFKYSNLNLQYKTDGKHILELLEEKDQYVGPADNVELQQMPNYLDPEESLSDRALAYLDVNCGHCHRPEGPGNTSGLFLQFNETRSNHLGLCKTPVAAGKGSGGFKYDIAPGFPEKSILIYRMQSQDAGVMMPELGRSIPHKEGIELVSEWIASLDQSCK